MAKPARRCLYLAHLQTAKTRNNFAQEFETLISDIRFLER